MAVYQRTDVADAFSIFTLPELQGTGLGAVLGSTSNLTSLVSAFIGGGVTDPVITLSDGSQLTVKGTFTTTVTGIGSFHITLSGMITGLERSHNGLLIETLSGVSAQLTGAVDYNFFGSQFTNVSISAPNFDSYFLAADQLNGGTQNDTMMGFGGSDVFNGGGGTNTADYTAASSAFTATIGLNGTGSVVGGVDVGTDTLSKMQNITGGAGGDTFLMADTGNNVLDGSGGSNTVSYASATRGIVAIVRSNNGTVTGTDVGIDTLKSIQKVIGGSANDAFYATGTLLASGGLAIDGGGGVNTLYELSSNAVVALNSLQYQKMQVATLYTGVVGGTIDATASTDFVTLYGAASGNTALKTGTMGGWMIADGGSNLLVGGADATHGDIFVNNHTATGLTTTATMNGGAGTNYFFAGAGDTVLGNANAVLNYEITIDQNMNVTLASGNLTVVALTGGGTTSADAFGNGTTTNVSKFVTLYGGAVGNFTLSTGTGGGYMIGLGGTAVESGHAQANNSDIFLGGNGTAATMNGGNGLNYYYVDGNDIVHGAGQVNHVIALAGNQNYAIGANFSNIQQVDLLSGTNTVDLSAQSGFIYVFGGAGNDTFIAGHDGIGNEVFAGRGGTNTFKFTNGWGFDSISDWAAGTNSKIDLSLLAAQGVHSISDLQISLSGANTLIAHAGHGSATDVLRLDGFTGALSASNFVFA